MKISLATAAVAALLSTSAVASAQPSPKPDYTEKKVDGGTVVTFPGDELPGDSNDPYFGLVKGLPRPIKAGLIQPRLNFVPELLKSVENL
jgi:hypothetical protein